MRLTVRPATPLTALLRFPSAVKETVMKQPFEIIKAANNGKTDADLIEGAGFYRMAGFQPVCQRGWQL